LIDQIVALRPFKVFPAELSRKTIPQQLNFAELKVVAEFSPPSSTTTMNPQRRVADKKPSFVLKEFLAQKDKSTNDAVVTLRPEMYAVAKGVDTEAKLKKDTIGRCPSYN
jgi:hypothetical protein